MISIVMEVHPMSFELPGGCLEEGEDIVHGGIRELQEETGGITAEFELVGKAEAESFYAG